MKRQPCSINGVPKARRISYKITKKLGESYEIDERCSRKNEEAIQSEKKKSSRIKVWGQYMVREQEYLFEQTLKKAGPKKYRPFRISKNIGLGVFQLELPKEWIIHNMFNEDLLTRCDELQFIGQHMEPALLPTIINKEEEYKVKEIQKHKKWGREMQYLVYWKGYGNKHDQWITETRLSHVKRVIKDYWTRYSS